MLLAYCLTFYFLLQCFCEKKKKKVIVILEFIMLLKSTGRESALRQ